MCVCVCIQIQNKQRDLDALNTRYETLLAQIRDNQEKYRKEEEDLHVRMNSIIINRLKITAGKDWMVFFYYSDLLHT